MKAQRPVALVAGGMLLALVSAAAACGGGDDGDDVEDRLALEEYFQQYKASSDEANDRSQALLDEVPLEFETEAEEIEATRVSLEGFAAVIADFVAALDGLDPPPAVEDAHKETVGAGEDWVGLVRDRVEQIGDVESVSELDELFEDPAPSNASDRFDRGCMKLQAIANANEMDVNLECGPKGA